MEIQHHGLLLLPSPAAAAAKSVVGSSDGVTGAGVKGGSGVVKADGVPYNKEKGVLQQGVSFAARKAQQPVLQQQWVPKFA